MNRRQVVIIFCLSSFPFFHFFSTCLDDGYVTPWITWEAEWARKGMWWLKYWCWISEGAERKWGMFEQSCLDSSDRKDLLMFLLAAIQFWTETQGKDDSAGKYPATPEENWIESQSAVIKVRVIQNSFQEPYLLSLSVWFWSFSDGT